MKLILFIFLFISTHCFSQKHYVFDNLIAYELTFYKDSIKIKNRPLRERDSTIKKYYLTNSKKNNYTAILTELDSLRYQMIFKDENGLYANMAVTKSDFYKADFINIDCNNVNGYQNSFKYKTKYYQFLKLPDTVLHGASYTTYKLESIKPKRNHRKKIGTEFYIIEKETSFHLPVFDFSTAYEEWKKERNIPNGIFLQKYFIDHLGQLDYKEQLINYSKINKEIVISGDCD